MLVNIVDSRTNKYATECDAAFEPSWHDNSIEGATHFMRDDGLSSYEELLLTTVGEAIGFANKCAGEFTLYLYDPGSLSVETHDAGISEE